MTQTGTGKLYSDGFFDKVLEGARNSASMIVPHALEAIPAKSVIDIGCGDGTWLAEFQARGVSDVLGVDGDYVERSRLRIDPSRFRPHDLTKPLNVGRRFDLSVSFEVGEHLPSDAAETFMDSICATSDRVLFSAAIPYQDGIGHVNPQWQSYWAAHFAKRGYDCFDLIRPLVWDSPSVEAWYAQNMLLYVRRGSDPELVAKLRKPMMLDVVHPRSYEGCARAATRPGELMSVPTLARALPQAMGRAVRRRLGL